MDPSSDGLDFGYDFSPLDYVLDAGCVGRLEIGEGQFGDPFFDLAFARRWPKLGLPSGLYLSPKRRPMPFQDLWAIWGPSPSVRTKLV